MNYFMINECSNQKLSFKSIKLSLLHHSCSIEFEYLVDEKCFMNVALKKSPLDFDLI